MMIAANTGNVDVFTTLTLCCAGLNISLVSNAVAAPDNVVLSYKLPTADIPSASNNLSLSNTTGMTWVVGARVTSIAARENLVENCRTVRPVHACIRHSESVGDRELSREDVLASPLKGRLTVLTKWIAVWLNAKWGAMMVSVNGVEVICGS